MEFLKDTENFGVGYQKGEDLERFFEKIISFLERRVFNRISKKVNYLLKRVNDNKLEVIADGNADKDEDGNWRFRESNGDLVIEKRIDGTWTNADTIAGS